MSTQLTNEQFRAGQFIPWMIVAFFVVITMVFAGFTYIALSTYRGVVTDEAYEKGVAYNKVLERANAQAALHMSSKTQLDGHMVDFKLLDYAGMPVVADKVTLVMFRPTQEGMDHQYEMTTVAQGFYHADISDLPAKGIWEARVYAYTAHGVYRSSQRVVVK